MSRLTCRFSLSFSNFHFQIEMDTPAHGILAVLGPSGSGKTTLLRCLAGLDRSPSGFMKLGDCISQDESRGVFFPLHQRSIGYVFQEPRLFPHLTVKANLEYGLRRQAMTRRKLGLDDIVPVLGLDRILPRRPGKLSGGEQQRVAIGRALLTSPTLLLLDEPLSSLDGQRKGEVLPFIRRLSHELDIPVVYVSHSLPEVLQIATSVAMVRGGKLLACGELEDVFSRLELRGSFADQEVGAILDTKIVGHDEEFGLSRVEFLGHSLLVPKQNLPVGTMLRVHILSRDVSLVAGVSTISSSVLNVLEGTVVEIGQAKQDQYAVDVKVDVGRPLLARITKKSLSHLALKPGQRVYAHVKAVALSQDGDS